MPTTDPAGLLVAARRSSAFAGELTRCLQLVTSAATDAPWSGAASDAFRDRLGSATPNVSATVARFERYAASLTSYAAAVSTYGGELRWRAAALADRLAHVQLAAAQASSARQDAETAAAADPGANLGLRQQPPADLAKLQSAQADAQYQADQADAALLSAARDFASLRDSWVSAVAAAKTAIQQANADDPTHDLHGWNRFIHDVRSAPDCLAPVMTFVLHPSWANASHALTVLSSAFTLAGLGLLLVCPPLAGACLTIAAGLSALQFGVDAYRRYGLHEDVSLLDLTLDGAGALPVGGLFREGRSIVSAGRQAARVRVEESSLRAFASGAAPAIRGSAVFRRPLGLYDLNYRELPRNLYRSRTHDGVRGLLTRWRSLALWDAPNAVLGMSPVGSMPQLVFGPLLPHRPKRSDAAADD